MADEDYYNARGDAMPEGADQSSEEKKPDDQPDTNSALVPNSLFGDKPPEVGAEIKVRVVKTYGDEIEIEVVNEEMDDNKNTRKMPNMDKAEAALGDMGTMQGE
jgi:hypothetical protein